MPTLSRIDNQQLRVNLQDAVIKCSDRGLYQAAKWAAELLVGLPPEYEPDLGLEQAEQIAQMSDPDASAMQDTVHPQVGLNRDPEEARLEAREMSKFLLAKSYFDCKEYDRCAAVLIPENLPSMPVAARPTPEKGSTGKGKARAPVPSSPPSGKAVSGHGMPHLSQRATFLALYARYLAGEKRKEEDSEMILGPADGGTTVNRELGGLAQKLEVLCTERLEGDNAPGASQGWLEFLYGVVLAKEKNDEEAKRWLIRSVGLYPHNWSAWQELAGLVGSVEDLHNILPSLMRHLMTYIFRVYVSQELYQSTEQVYGQMADLERIYPESVFLKTQRALLHYHSKDFDEAEAIFSDLIHHDPYRIDSLDHYSNILYVMNLRPKLAFLAQLATSTDKFRPETCCVVGNYYSLKSEHEKAVMYFRRALNLDRTFLSAWTLMGHEYVEMKNTHAAIESYRRAVDINRKDYRAWYGLGQTYEVLEMHYYALYYFQRAASLKPYDPKMWQAVGSCFNKMDRPSEAIKALKRALLAGTCYDQSGAGSISSGGGDPSVSSGGGLDPEVLHQIALLYERLDDADEASAYMELTVAQEFGGGIDVEADGEGNVDEGDDIEVVGRGPAVGVTQTTSKARMWLAKHEFRRGNYSRAMDLANELCHDGVDVEEAKALVRDLRARMETKGPSS